MKFGNLISRNLGKAQSVTEALTGRSTRWISEHFGVSRSTAFRWRTGRQRPGTGERKDAVMGSPDKDTRRRIAADAMRHANAVHVGKVTMRYPGGRGDGTQRNIGTVYLSPEAREKMNEAAEALERGDEQRAEDLWNDALLRSGNRSSTTGRAEYGPLDIGDYGPGTHLI